MAVIARLLEDPLDALAEQEALLAASGGSGAVVTFTGLARGATGTGAPVHRLLLESHPRLSLASIETIAADAAARFDVSEVRVAHRHGIILPGEPIVFVGAASAHRRAAFEAADYLMDRLKTEAVLWKREDTDEGSQWIEPTSLDHADKRRWSEQHGRN